MCSRILRDMTNTPPPQITRPDGLSTPRTASSAAADSRTEQALAAALASHDARTGTNQRAA
jgi:hypothetical protein